MSDPDITTWPVDKLDELALYAYADVAGVEIDELGEGDPLPEHGVNAEEEMR